MLLETNNVISEPREPPSLPQEYRHVLLLLMSTPAASQGQCQQALRLGPRGQLLPLSPSHEAAAAKLEVFARSKRAEVVEQRAG
jgi:hypothetical protein